MNKFKYALYRFMQGRYGNDTLNNALFIVILLAIIVNAFFLHSGILSIACYLVLAIVILRTYSRNVTARRRENAKFLKLIKPIRSRYQVIKKNRSDHAHKYYLCPHCKQIVRVPRGRGTIDITCPKCKTKFTKKS